MHATAPFMEPSVGQSIPAAISAAGRGEKCAKIQLRICISLFYTSILISSLAITVGPKQLPISWLVGLLHFGLLAFLTRGSFDPWRLIAFGATFALIIFESAVVHTSFSPTSVLYMAGIYGPLVLVAPLLHADDLRTIWKHVSILAVIITWCGLIQIVGQIAVKGLFIDPIRQLPQSILLQGYNTTYPVSYGNWLMKPNGMFLLEPSFFSQMLALGLLSEFVYFKRKARMLFFTVGIALSFSGTGLIILLAAIPFVGSFRAILGFAVLGAILLGVVVALGYGDLFLARATETTESRSSGHERFIAPYQEMLDGWEEKPSFFLFGKGAGVSERMSVAEGANFSAVPKVGVEFGFVGLVAFTGIWFGLFYGLALPRALVVGLLVFYFLASGSLLQPFGVFMAWAVTAGCLRKNRSGPRSPQLSSPALADVSFAKWSTI